MKLRSLIVMRPVCIFTLLAFIVLMFPSIVIPYWYKQIKNIEYEVKLNSENVRAELVSHIGTTANLLHPINSSASNLARFLSSSLNGTQLTFDNIENKVAPMLFQALDALPYVSQISYIGLDSLFFSYYISGDQLLAFYANTSLFPSNPSATWYSQPVNRDTGKLYGEAISSNSQMNVNASWFQEALNSTNGHASLGNGWSTDHELLFLNTASVDGRGALSLGFPVKGLTDFFSSIDFHGANLYLGTDTGTVLLEGIPNTQMLVGADSVSFKVWKPNAGVQDSVSVSCKSSDGSLKSSILNTGEKRYMVYCSPIDILGVQLVYALAFPHFELVSLVHRNTQLALVVLIAMIVSMVISISAFIFLIVRATRREMHLCASLIKQMEATQQAERKSMNKSNAYATANHDVRASLAGITGLIDMCKNEVVPKSELATNLRQMDACAKDLLGLLNSILDTSKIDAGKMQLEEEEFNLAELLEDVVDLFHPVGMKKNVDVVLDPHNGSVMKFSHVKGDRGKLKQILCNLLSNAVKFTSEGHVSVRAWVKKPSLESSIISSHKNGFLNCFSCLFFKNNKEYNDDLKTMNMNTVQQKPGCMEFVFEIDDTGKGIPKDQQKSVFENYVQVKETTPGQGGTGLGLGIVQSIVRLMGGEIGIVEKEFGQRGTCFMFNIFLTTCETTPNEGNLEIGGDCLPNDPRQRLGLHIRGPSPRLDGLQSHVVVLIKNNERRRIVQKFMESLGIKVFVVERSLSHTLKKIKHKLGKLDLSNYSSSGKSDKSSKSDCLNRSTSKNSSPGVKDVPLSSMDGTDQILPVYQRSNFKGGAATNCILILIDTSAGEFTELYRAVAEFRRDLNNVCCKVVWLDKQTLQSFSCKSLEVEISSRDDHVISKPFHGSRLLEVIGFLPEFGGSFQVAEVSTRPNTLLNQAYSRANSRNSPADEQQPPISQIKVQSLGSSSNEDFMSGKKTMVGQLVEKTEIQEVVGSSSEMPLRGKKILVAEDNMVLRRVAISTLSRLGATVEFADNGKVALELVSKGLREQRTVRASNLLPYDFVLMDCEMPVMDGFEATSLIRKEEKKFGVHIPIIALTAHTAGEELDRAMEVGMNFHLEKPLNKEKLLEAISYIQRN